MTSKSSSAPVFERGTKPFGAALEPVARSRLTVDDRQVLAGEGRLEALQAALIGGLDQLMHQRRGGGDLRVQINAFDAERIPRTSQMRI